MLIPLIPLLQNRSEKESAKPSWLELDPDEEFITEYSPANRRSVIIGIMCFVVAVIVGVLIVTITSIQGSSTTDLTEGNWSIIAIIIPVMVAAITVFAVTANLRTMVSVYLTSKALVFKQSGNWVALPLTDIVDTRKIGTYGKYMVLVYGPGGTKPLIQITTDTPDAVIKELQMHREAAVAGTKDRQGRNR